MSEQFSLFGGKPSNEEQPVSVPEEITVQPEEKPIPVESENPAPVSSVPEKPSPTPQVFAKSHHSSVESRIFKAHAQQAGQEEAKPRVIVRQAVQPVVREQPQVQEALSVPTEEKAISPFHVFRFRGEQMTREKVKALRDFLVNNPGETKVKMEVSLKGEDGDEYVCGLNLPGNLSIKEGPEIDVAVETIMRM